MDNNKKKGKIESVTYRYMTNINVVYTNWSVNFII